MSKFPERSNSALLVIDVQNGVVSSAWKRDQVISNINSLIAKARESNTPVVWVQHSDPYMEIGSEDWQLAPELKPLEGEPIIRKTFRSSFEDTNLDATLSDLGVGRLYITGAETNNCVRHTSHAALERGYDITLVKDAHTTSDWTYGTTSLVAADIVREANVAFYDYELPGRSSNLMATAEVTF